jgi:hypothetical protein
MNHILVVIAQRKPLAPHQYLNVLLESKKNYPMMGLGSHYYMQNKVGLNQVNK